MTQNFDSRVEWSLYFDEVWQLTDWLSDYGTVYHRPSTDADTTYTPPETLSPASSPDAVVDFDDHDDIISCFFVDGESIEQFSGELIGESRLGTYAIVDDPVSINPSSATEPQTPDGDLLVTQFAPFGHILYETIPAPSSDVNEDIKNFTHKDDFFTFLIGNIFTRSVTSRKQNTRRNNQYDPFETYHGILAGSLLQDQTRKVPTALCSPHPENDDFWYAYWQRYNYH